MVSKESQQTQLSNEGQAAGSIKADNAAIQAAKVNLSYTSIYSPINGVVGLRGVDPGNIVHASDSTGLVVITQVHPIAIIFTLPEDQLPQVQQAMHGGSKLVVEAYDRNDAHKIAAGTLLTIDNQIDTTTGTAKLKAVFDNKDNALFPNQFVNVRLILRAAPERHRRSHGGDPDRHQGTFVFVVHPGPGTAKARQGRRRRRAGGKPQRQRCRSTGSMPAASSPQRRCSSSGSAGGRGGKGGGGNAQALPRPNTVTVHVDFTQGSNTILANGAVKAGDPSWSTARRS